ncbi:MAG: rRNA maturation RNase YbeY [Acetobacteraceae bacterium]
MHTPAHKHVDKPAVIVQDPAWRRRVPGVLRIAERAAAIAGTTAPATVVLASDRTVRRLNARHRGRSRATNVLSFPGSGEIVLALGVVCREARAVGQAPGAHLAHLVTHGALHLAGHDHHRAGEARRMALAETRLMRRLGVPDPWRRA